MLNIYQWQSFKQYKKLAIPFNKDNNKNHSYYYLYFGSYAHSTQNRNR
ncbi:hypothetical protein NTGHW29_740010 [Candidatus Nitrotoga sp. HW29]|nr:hypothetical protein NTGHW29_740010 [Candidatus Nitrotoga sp. HW29]